MTLLSLPQPAALVPTGLFNNALGAVSLSATNTKVGIGFLVPPGITDIVGIGFRVSTVTVGQNVAVSLQTNTARAASGSNAGGSVGQSFTPAANTNFFVTYATPATGLIPGAPVVSVWEWVSTAGTTVSIAGISTERKTALPWGALYAAGAWGAPQVLNGGGFYVRNAAGDEVPIGLPAVTSAVANNSNVGGRRLACKYSYPFQHRVIGFHVLHALAGAASFEVSMYAADGTTRSGTQAYTGLEASSVFGAAYYPLASPVTVNANEIAYPTLTPTSAVNVQVVETQLISAAHRIAFPLGTNFCKSLYLTVGGWVDSTDTLVGIIPVIDQVSSGGGIFLIED